MLTQHAGGVLNPPAMKTKHPPLVVAINPTLPSLGRALSVTYCPATGARGSRWRAKISDGMFTVTASAPFDYSGHGNDGRDAAAVACLEKYAKSFDRELGPQRATLDAVANGPDGYLYFFTLLCGKGAAE